MIAGVAWAGMVVAACYCFDAAALLLLRLPWPLDKMEQATTTRAFKTC
jgi:hypothetical protein